MSFLKKITAATKFISDVRGTPTFHLSSFIKSMSDYGIAIDKNDVRETDVSPRTGGEVKVELVIRFDSMAFDGSVDPSTLKKMQDDLDKLPIYFARVDTRNYIIHLIFDEEIDID